eukprot:m.348748 g.348748  ORF g.348748 m.348748 type:complete len:440 (-) comp16148_c1_seq8:1894-3213(-)
MAAKAESSHPSPARQLIYKLGVGVHPMVKQTLDAEGWREWTEEDGEGWNLQWKSARYSAREYEDAQPWQMLNHIPRSTGITRKDSLCRVMKKMRKVYGNVYSFCPLSFIIPTESPKFHEEYERTVVEDAVWICKPSDSSRGRGIYLFKSLDDLQYDATCVVQRYIDRPLTISGYKLDMRLYVLVTSFRPMTVFLYREGLARFGTEPYQLDDITRPYAHLTNTSINKLNPETDKQDEVSGAGCKWTIRQLRQHFRTEGLDDARIWRRVSNLVIRTLLAVADQVPTVTSCFELYGFDVMLDAELKPWLIEANFSPALGLDCQQDRDVKIPLIRDTIKALNYEASHEQQLEHQRAARPSSGRKRQSATTQPHLPVEVGGFSRIFPFNRQTLAATSGPRPPDIRLVLKEVARVSKLAKDSASDQSSLIDAEGGDHVTWYLPSM